MAVLVMRIVHVALLVSMIVHVVTLIVTILAVRVVVVLEIMAICGSLVAAWVGKSRLCGAEKNLLRRCRRRWRDVPWRRLLLGLLDGKICRHGICCANVRWHRRD
jgi:hypothetical protein